MNYFIQITQPGWDTFHGDMAGYLFENGKSIQALPRSICDRIGALVMTKLIDDGADIGQAGAAERIASRRGLEATVGVSLARMTGEQKSDEQVRDAANAGATPNNVKEFYTQDQLEAIAEQTGIQGLREVAAPWAVKDRSIPKLVTAILRAQDNFLRIKKQKQEELRANREAALGDAKAKAFKLEQDALKNARVLIDDGTPNAVGPDGKAIYVAPKKPKTEEETTAELAAIEAAGAEISAANQELNS